MGRAGGTPGANTEPWAMGRDSQGWWCPWGLDFLVQTVQKTYAFIYLQIVVICDLHSMLQEALQKEPHKVIEGKPCKKLGSAAVIQPEMTLVPNNPTQHTTSPVPSVHCNKRGASHGPNELNRYFMDILQGGPQTKGMLSAYISQKVRGWVLDSEDVLDSEACEHDVNSIK